MNTSSHTNKPTIIDPEKIWVNVFRAGKHQSSNGIIAVYTADDLKKIANEYNEGNDPAPVVVGHPKTDAPAYGWVEKLRVQGNILQAKFHKLNKNFIEAVRDGAYKQISISLRPAHVDRQPLSHVGFLGGKPPAIAGLGTVDWCAEDEFQSFTTTEGTKAMPTESHQNENAKNQDKTDQNTQDFSEREEKLAAREKALAAKEASENKDFSERQAQLEARVFDSEFAAFEGELKLKGIVNPLGSDLTKQLLKVADGSATEFAEGDESVPLGTAFKAAMLGLAPSIDFAEKTKASNSDQQDICSSKIISQARKYAEENSISFVQAVNIVSKKK